MDEPTKTICPKAEAFGCHIEENELDHLYEISVEFYPNALFGKKAA